MTCGASPRDHHPVRRRRSSVSTELILPRKNPDFSVAVSPPDIKRWEAGNNGIPGVVERDSGHPGPDVTVVCLVHGNEFAGATAADLLLRDDIRPLCGTLRFVFANIDAFHRFDPANPTASRYVSEDLNRVWEQDRLSREPRSQEMARARELLPVIEQSDLLLDLHSMLWDSAPLFISPPIKRSVSLAGLLSSQSDTSFLTLTDLGHVGGTRLIEHERFRRPGNKACSALLEAGQHWQPGTVETSIRVIRHFVENSGRVYHNMIDTVGIVNRQAVVTDNILACSARFSFTSPYRGCELIEHKGTVIALDGDDEICTPYDRCLLIMPNLCARRGQLAVRLARLL